jgi:hypothetical protein
MTHITSEVDVNSNRLAGRLANRGYTVIFFDVCRYYTKMLVSEALT